MLPFFFFLRIALTICGLLCSAFIFLSCLVVFNPGYALNDHYWKASWIESDQARALPIALLLQPICVCTYLCLILFL